MGVVEKAETRSVGCGKCTMCCKTHRVPELEKPANVWCQHCDKGVGCKIYDTRPQSCRDFECMWLQSQVTDKPLPWKLRPDRCGVVLATPGEIMTVNVNAGVDWRKGLIGKLIQGCINRGLCVVVKAEGKIKMINPTKEALEIIKRLQGDE